MSVTTEDTDRRLGVFVACAVAGIAPLMVKVNLVVAVMQVQITTSGHALLPHGFVDLLPLAAPLVALLIWRRQPGRSWSWLLLAGTVFSLPALLNALDVPLDLTGFDGGVVRVLGQCAPAVNLVGVLGAATWLHQRGRRSAAAAVVGTALLCQLVGAVVLQTAGFDAFTFTRVVIIVLFAVGGVGAVGAVLLSRSGPMTVTRRPSLRVTVVGGVAAATSALLLLWQPDQIGFRYQVDDYYLQLGLVFLAAGVVLGLLGGPRLLLGAAAAGLLIGPFGMLITPSVEILDQFPVLSIVAVLVSTAIAYLAATSGLRRQFAVGGLGTVAAGMILLFVLFNADDPLRPSDTFDQVFTPILVVIGVIAAGCALATIGAATADDAATPAVLAGASTPFSLGTIAIITHFTLHHPDDKAPIVGLLPPVIVCVLVAATLVAVARPERTEPIEV